MAVMGGRPSEIAEPDGRESLPEVDRENRRRGIWGSGGHLIDEVVASRRGFRR